MFVIWVVGDRKGKESKQSVTYICQNDKSNEGMEEIQ